MPVTRRELLVRGGVLATGAWFADGRLLLPPATAAAAPPTTWAPPAGAWERSDYLAFADRVFAHLVDDWRPADDCYRGGTSTNANLLCVHAQAAANGWTGACRDDDRARRLAWRLCQSPPYRVSKLAHAVTRDPVTGAHLSKDQTHLYGWGAAMDTVERQHVVIDTAVVRGLAHAYLAREALGLPARTADLIADHLRRCAYSTFYTFPALRLNQINWPIEIYTHAAQVLGDTHLLRHDERLQLGRFADRMTHGGPGRLPYTGPGYRFHRFPQASVRNRVNLDSTEYACIVCGALSFYEEACAAGMRVLDARQVATLHAWVERVLCGYWTHAGYPNWDTGEGFDRWHQTKKWPLCQEALLAIAVARRFWGDRREYGDWAKWILDRGFATYDRMLAEREGLPPAVLFDVATGGAPGDQELTAARFAANAMRAVEAGLGERRSAEPPALYAYDPDVGRLAVTTRAYSTAVMPCNFHAFPYGGLEPARLFDRDLRVLTGVGGTGNAALGVVVHDHGTGATLRSQSPRAYGDLAHPPLRLLHAPRGVGTGLAPYPRHAYAGPFSTLVATGSVEGAGAHAVVRHTFRPGHIDTRWTVTRTAAARGPHTVRVLFPSWGGGATVTVVHHGGAREVLGRAPVPLASVREFEVAGSEGGYGVRLLSRPAGVARLLHPGPQPADPHPGPTLALELLSRGRLRPTTLTVRVTPGLGRQGSSARRRKPSTRRS